MEELRKTMPKNKEQYTEDQKARGGKISWEDYERTLKQLDANLLHDPCAPYIQLAVEALDNNIALSINAKKITASKNGAIISEDELKALHQRERHKKKHFKKAQKNKYKNHKNADKTAQSNTLADKLTPLPEGITDKIEAIVEDFRIHRRGIKSLFQTATKAKRKDAYRLLKSPNLMLTEKGASNYSAMQLTGFFSVAEQRDTAQKKIKNILRNPINGFKADAIEIIKNENIRTQDVDEFLPDEMIGLRRTFAKTLIMESKREYMFLQNLFKKLDPKIMEEFTKAVNQEGEYKGMGFKHIRPFIGPAGTAEYIKNSGLVTDRQNQDVRHLMNNIDRIKNGLHKND